MTIAHVTTDKDKMPGRAWRSFFERLRLEIADQKPQLFLWAPIFLAFGIAIYFSLPVQPPPAVSGILFLLALSGLILSRYHVAFLLILIVVSGFGAAHFRTHRVHTPVLQEERAPVTVEGTIRSIEDMGEGEGSRIVLSALEIEDVGPAATPRRVRLRLRQDQGVRVGQRVRVLAGLMPPSLPVMPGAFDFQRYLYFQGIGAVGFVYRGAEIIRDEAGAGRHWLETRRRAIAEDITANLDYPEAGMAQALMIGRKTAMREADKEAMRNAGLAHMLAISGLHIGLFAGVIFFISRLMMVAIPGFALRRPAKKYAALLAIGGAFVYMLVAGATIPTQRAVLMTGIVFAAIMMDRSPISLRLVAFAAFIILLFFPESLLSASFHMSFAAVTALILFYDWLRPWWSSWHSQAGVFKRAALYFSGVIMTTVIAGLATAPFALFHFNQFALYNVAANMVAMPILAFLIMPAVAAAFLLMPFRLAFPAFEVMDFGIEMVLETAHFIAGLPHAILMVPSWPLAALGSFVLGALFFFLWKGRLRFTALLGFVLFIYIILNYKQADIVISSESDLAAFEDHAGAFHISSRRTQRFTGENWSRIYGLTPEEAVLWPKEGGNDIVMCDSAACRIHLSGFKTSYLKAEAAARAECAYADIVIAPFPVKRCKAPHVIDYYDTRYRGAHAIWLGEDRVLIRNVGDLRGRRPWSGANGMFNDRF